MSVWPEEGERVWQEGASGRRRARGCGKISMMGAEGEGVAIFVWLEEGERCGNINVMGWIRGRVVYQCDGMKVIEYVNVCLAREDGRGYGEISMM